MSNYVFLEAADRIGATLCRDAIWSQNKCNWTGWAIEFSGAGWGPVYRAQGPTLYDGAAGIAIFLAHLSALTGDRLQRQAAVGALNCAFSGLDRLAPDFLSSIYSGAAGVAYAAIQAGEALGERSMVRRGLDLLMSCTNTPLDGKWLDVLGGSAGCIPVLLQHGLVEEAVTHGKVLLRAAVKSDRGWSWDTMTGQTTANLTGYGHGAAGIATALLELWRATRDNEFKAAALEAFRYEQSYFSQENHNWPDLRSMTAYGVPASQTVYAVAWCHGAPGIGLARLRALEILGDEPAIRHDLDAAIQSTLASLNAPGTNMSLCHGTAGNADLLIDAARTLDRADLLLAAENAARQAIDQQAQGDMPWPCGVNGGGETPNLMLGLAGIGYFFLRLNNSRNVPSVLLLRGAAARESVRNSASEAAAVSA